MMTRRKPASQSSRAYLVSGRILVLFLLTLVAVMPLTEYLWHFDQFICSGQDFEFGLLSVMTFLCLILVLFKQGKCSVAFFLALRCWFAFVFRRGDPGAPGALIGLITPSHAVPLPSPALGLYNLPSQI